MAQNFKNFLTRNIGTSAVPINVATNTCDTLIGIRLCNVAAVQILMDVYITRSAANYYLAFNVPIPAGGQYEVMDGGAKIVLESGDQLNAISDTASSCDVVTSRVDDIST